MPLSNYDVSVVIPVYNGEEYVAQAVRSVQRQTYAPAEVIVVDDGSTDRTASALRSLRDIRVAHQPNSGPAAARNHGLGLCTGKLVNFLDADDLWVEGKLDIQLPLLNSDPDLDIVIGQSQRVIVSHWELGHPVYKNVDEPVFYLHLGSALIRRSVFDRIGPFEVGLAVSQEHQSRVAVGEEVDWYLRAKEAGVKMRFHQEVMQFCLRHDRNITLQRKQMNQYMVRLLKRSLDRRRSAMAGAATSLDWSRETAPLTRGSK